MDRNRASSLALGFLLLGITLPAGAQSDSTGRWTIGLNAGAGTGYRTLSQTDHSANSEIVIRRRNEQEKPLVAFTAAVSAGYRLSRRFGLDLGLGYSQMGWLYRWDLSDLSFGDMIDPRRGFIYRTDDVAIPSKLVVHDIFHYAELRIGATLSLGNGHWRSVSSIGVAPSLLIAAKTRTKSEFVDGRTERKTETSGYEFERFNLFPYLSTGIAYHSGQHWEWSLQPTARYGVLRIIDTPITAYLWSVGLQVGCMYRL